MTTELDDLKELVAVIKADQRAQQEKTKREAWTKYVSLTMIVLAVCAAISTQRAGGYSSATIKQLNEATFYQAKASDAWAYYQAKGIKGSIAKEQNELLMVSGGADPKKLAALAATIQRYENEQKDITKEAKELEAKRDVARELATRAANQSREMGLAMTVYQIAIALGGITLVVKKRWLWYASTLAGAGATLQMVYVLAWM